MTLTIPPYVPPVPGAGTLNGQRELSKQVRTIAAASTTIPVIYGEAQVGGRIFAAVYSGGFWYLGVAFCLGEIDSYTALYLNGVDVKPSTPAGMTITYYTGTTSQTADATLASVISGYVDTLIYSTASGSVGVAYCVLKYSEANYSGFPTIVAKIKGRKVRPLSENLINDSEDITGTGWIAGNVDTSRATNVVGITAPDGTVSADKIQEATTTSNQHFIATPTVSNLPDNAIVTFSVFCKSAERTFVRIMVLTKAGVTSYTTVDLSTGIVQNTSGLGYIDSGAIDAGSGWYRVFVTANVGTGATVPRGRIFTMQNATTQSYVGTVNSGLYVWGSQFELKATPGIYTKTTTTASAAAWSDNPVLCARDLILTGSFGLGEDVDDLSAKHTQNECDALVTTEKRRTLNLVIDSARAATDWIQTLATYCGAFIFKSGGRWVFRADRPAILWQFTSTANNWSATNATLTTGATTLTVTQTAADVFLASPSGLNICGSAARYIRARIRRVSGTATVDGSIYWVTANHGTSESNKSLLTWTTANGTWATVEWDMYAPSTGGLDWRESIITQIRLDLSQTAGTDVWEIDWISVGIEPVTKSDVVADSFSAGTADAAQIPTALRVDYTDASTTEFKTRPAYAEIAGVSTGAVARRESVVQLPGVTRYSQAYREAAERLAKLNNHLYCEFIRFDEGLFTEIGDVLSVMHPYTDTSNATECDDATLFRVVDTKVIGPGRVRVRATQYDVLDYDNSESTTTWGAYTRRAGNLGGSGDGINRIQPRFAGGFATVDYDGQFPVTKGANISQSAVLAGTGAPDPTSGYYGAYALKIGTASSGSDRTVWFGSSSTDYTIPIDPNSKWLFSCKFWPRVANTSVGFTLKSGAGTTYSLTDTTNTASAWNEFVDTASGSNLLNLVNDASASALFALSVNAASTFVWFDGLMLEKQVGEGAIVSSWRPPVSSAINPARISPRLVAPGTLDDSVAIDDGAGNARTIASGVFSGTAIDGQAITFTPAYSRVPVVTFTPAALTYSTAGGFGSGNSQTLVCEARDLTASGFTAYLKVRTLATTVTTTTDTYAGSGGADTGAGNLPRYTIQKSNANQAWDDKYTFTFTVVVKNIRTGEPGFAFWEPGQATIGVYIATADSGATLYTPTWTKVASVSVNGGSGASTTTRTGLTVTVVRDGLTQRGGTCPEFGIGIESELISGGTLTFTSVKYDLAVTGATETPATGGGASPVPFTVISA